MYSLFNRLQEKHVKDKQCEHQRSIIEMQERIRKCQAQVSYIIWFV